MIWVLIAIISILCVIFAFKRNINTAKFLILYCVFQNFILVLLAKYLSQTQYTILVLLKEIMVILTIVVSLFHKKRQFTDLDKICIFSIVLLMFLMLLPGGNFSQKLTSFRQLYIPFAFVLFGRSLRIRKNDLFKLIKFFVVVMIICGLFGVFEISYGLKLWDQLGYGDFSMLKYGQVFIYNGLKINYAMISYDFYSITGTTYFRECSFLVDSVIYGQLLSFACVAVLSFKKKMFKHYRIVFLFLLINLLLTLSKTGILILALYLIVLIVQKITHCYNLKILLPLILLTFIVALIVTYPILSTVRIHLEGLTSSFPILLDKPLGGGIGTFGNLAKLFSDKDTSNGESFIGASIGQIGLFTIIYLVLFWRLYFYNLRNVKSYRFLSILILALFLDSLVNNTAVSFTSCFIFFIPFGISENISFQVAKVKRVNKRLVVVNTATA